MSKMIIIEGNSNEKDNVRTYMVKGERGYSAYDLYVQNGGTLTEEEWLDEFLNAENFYNKSEIDTSQTNQNNVINKKPYYFNSVAEMKAYNLQVGSMAITNGYYSSNDGGGAEYYITNSVSSTEYQEELINNLYATLITKESTIPEIFGAKGDGINNDTLSLEKMFSSNSNNFKGKNNYKFNSITINNKKLINISGGTFEGHLTFNNCEIVLLNDIEFLSGNSNFDEIINCSSCDKVIVKNCKFDGKLINDTTKGLKITNSIDFECVNSNFDNFDGKTDVDVLPNGNSAGSNTRNQTTGIFLSEITNISIKRCNFYNILGRSGVYIENCSTIEVNNNNFNYIYGSAVHIGNYYKNIVIENNYIQFCAITGISSSDFLYLHGGNDGAIDVYGAENYFNYLATDSNIEINNNYFYECGTREGISVNYYVYTDETKQTLATHYSNGDPIGTQPLSSTTRLQCIRLANSYKGNIHDNLIVHGHNRILSTSSRQKYDTNSNNYTFTNNSTLKIQSNKIILNDYAYFYLHGVISVEFINNTIEAISTDSEYISTSDRSEVFETTNFLVNIINPKYSNVVGNLILTDVYSGIYNQIGSHSNINDNTIECWSFGIYIPKFNSLNIQGNRCWVGRTVNNSPTEADGMDSGGIYINQENTNSTSCVISNNASPIITNVATNVINKSNVTGISSGNLSTNSGAIFTFGAASKLFEVKLPIDDKYYIELSDSTRKEFNLE